MSEAILEKLDKVIDSQVEYKKVIKEQAAELVTIKTRQEQIVSDMSRWDKDVKSSMEELTKVKNTCNDLAQATLQLKRLQEHVAAQASYEWKSPIGRLISDPGKKAHLNRAIRKAAGRKGDLDKQIEILTKAIGEVTSPGSTLFDDILVPDVYDTLAQYGIWNTFRTYRCSTKVEKFPVKTVRPTALVYLTDGTGIGEDASKAGVSVSLQVELLGVLLSASLQLIQDSAIDVAADVLDDFMQAIAERLDYFCLSATGAADTTNGGMTGIFVGGTASVPGGAGKMAVANFVVDDFINAMIAVDPIVNQRATKWWMHPQMLIRCIKVKDSNGRPIFLTALEAPSQGALGSILGSPVVSCMKANNTEGASFKLGVYGDPDGLAVGVREDFAFDTSDHFHFDAYQRAFRGTCRAGVKIRRALAFAVLTGTAT